MIFWRGKASYLYSTVITIRGDRKGNREKARTVSRRTLKALGICARRNLWEGFPKVTEALVKLQSHSESSRGGLEHCIPVMVTEFKLSNATSARALVASHSIRRLVLPFVMFRNSTMDVYTLTCIYYVFLEIVGI